MQKYTKLMGVSGQVNISWSTVFCFVCICGYFSACMHILCVCVLCLKVYIYPMCVCTHACIYMWYFLYYWSRFLFVERISRTLWKYSKLIGVFQPRVMISYEFPWKFKRMYEHMCLSVCLKRDTYICNVWKNFNRSNFLFHAWNYKDIMWK